MIKHGERAAGNSRLAEAVDRCLHKNICQAKHRTLYRRGQAGFAARTRGQDRSFRFAGFISCSPEHPIHDMGGLRHHGDGGKGNGHQHPTRFDIKARPYKIEIRPLEEPYYRSIGLAMKNNKNLTPAVQKFIEYLPFRETE